MNLSKEQIIKIKNFVENKKLLLVDSSVASRSNIKKCFIVLGVKNHQIDEVESFSDAKEFLAQKKHAMIISDVKVGNESGLKLCQHLVTLYPDFSERLFLLTMSDLNESILVEASEEEVDAVLLKPYTMGSLTNTITKSLLQKVELSDYKKTVEKGKKDFLNQFDSSLKTFQTAVSLDPKPFLAYFYMGRIFEKKIDDAGAMKFYLKALEFDPHHFKSQLALVDIYLRSEEKNKAYYIIKDIFKKYPVSTNILALAFELAVFTQSFEDILSLYDRYLKIDVKNEEINKKVSAALIIGASHFLRKNLVDLALESLQKSITTSGKQDWVLIECALCLYRNGKSELSGDYLNQVSKEGRESEKFKKVDFYNFSKIHPAEDYTNYGRKLLLDGLIDREVSEITLTGLSLINKNEAFQQVFELTLNKIPGFKFEVKNR